MAGRTNPLTLVLLIAACAIGGVLARDWWLNQTVARRDADILSSGDRDDHNDSGGRAIIEVIFLAVLMLIPVTYILFNLLRLRAATLAITCQTAQHRRRCSGCSWFSGGSDQQSFTISEGGLERAGWPLPCLQPGVRTQTPAQ